MSDSGQCGDLEVNCYISSQVQVTHKSRYKWNTVMNPESWIHESYTCSRFLFHCLTKWFNIRVGAVPSLICPNLMVFLWKNRLCTFQNQLLQLAFGILFKVTWGHFVLSTVCLAYTDLLWLQLWDFLFTSLLWDQQNLLYFSREQTNKQTW